MPKGTKIAPLERRQWLEEYEQNTTVAEIARKAGRTSGSVKDHLERARQEREFQAARSGELQRALQNHQIQMLGLISRLAQTTTALPLDFRESPPFGLEDLGEPAPVTLRSLANETVSAVIPELPSSRTIVGSQPVVEVTRDKAGPQTAVFTEESTRLWTALMQHLGRRDPLWPRLRAWHDSLLKEAQARAALNRLIKTVAEPEYGAPVTNASTGPHLTLAMVHFIREESTRQALGERATELHRRLQMRGQDLEDPPTGTYLTAGLLDQKENRINQLAVLIHRVASSDEAKEVAISHQLLDKASREANEILEEYLLIGYIRGTCRIVCQKLGDTR